VEELGAAGDVAIDGSADRGRSQFGFLAGRAASPAAEGSVKRAGRDASGTGMGAASGAPAERREIGIILIVDDGLAAGPFLFLLLWRR
jgi:hypothetical protein